MSEKERAMKQRNWAKLAALSVGTVGVALAVKSFLPQRFPVADWPDSERGTVSPDIGSLPPIEIEFLRCGSVTIPECCAARGVLSVAPRVISHSAVLIRHPKATFLFDTGLCADVYTYLIGQPLLFRKVLANFRLEQSLGDHLREHGIRLSDLDFVLLSHLHWDHVGGIPDLPGVPLRVNRVEYEAAQCGLFEANNGLVRQLMCDNPVDYFECDGPAYDGFRASFDLFGDGSIMLVPLPGHTAGSTGMLIHRANGSRVFLLGDAAWVSENYLRPTTMHPFLWNGVTTDDATARQTLIQLHHYAKRNPDVPLIGMHDGALQEAFMAVERPILASQL